MATLLVADDHEDIRALLMSRLRKQGFAVKEASSGRDVMNLLELETFDLVLMDMNMPEMDGWQTTSYIRSIASFTKLPIIALTAYALEGDRARALQAGCNAFQCKPVNFEQLLATIYSLLEAKTLAP
jgi:CheY-like chemotaxis protein